MAVVVALAGFSVSSLSAPSAGASEPPIVTAGGSAATAAMQSWVGAFDTDGGNVNYTSSSPASGPQEFSQDLVDAALSDITYSAGTFVPPTQPFQYVPVAEAGDSFEYNLTGAHGGQIKHLLLNAATIGDIFLGKITKWNAAPLRALNPGVALPDKGIKVFYQSESSEDDYLLSDYLQSEDTTQYDDYLSAIGNTSSGPSLTWPAPAAGLVPAGFPNWGTGNMKAEGTAGLALGSLTQTKNAITFALTGLGSPLYPDASVVNASGHAEPPTAANLNVALTDLTLPEAFAEDYGPEFASTQPTAYPLSTYDYLLSPCNPSLAAAESPAISCSGSNTGTSEISSASGAELGQFIDYAVCAGQEFNETNGFGTLSRTVVESDFADIGAINGAAEPPSPTSTTCPGPLWPPQLNSTGSSLTGIAMEQWAGQFNELYNGNVNFTVSDSVIGLNDFASQSVDFATSDFTYAAAQGSGSPSVPYAYAPDVGYGLAFEYSLTSPKTGKPITSLVLTPQVIAGIFTGAITRWNNSSIQASNPSVVLPDEPITAYYRSDPSGENWLLSSYLLETEPAEITTFQQAAGDGPVGQPSTIWAAFPNGTPPEFSTLVPVSGAVDAQQGPVHTPGGISFVAEAYADDAQLPSAFVVNASGTPVQPTFAHIVKGLAGATFNADRSANLTGVFENPAAGAYPISNYGYLVVPCDPTRAAAENPPTSCSGNGGESSPYSTESGAELGQFIDYMACQGQARMAALGYAPLPKNLVEGDFSAIGAINGAKQPPAPTTSNCPDPGLTAG